MRAINNDTIQALKLKHLNELADALIRNGCISADVPKKLLKEILELERLVGGDLVFDEQAGDGRRFRAQIMQKSRADRGYFKTSKPNAVRILNAKLAGVIISVNLQKDGVYDHDNKVIVESLRDLANRIEGLTVRLADIDCDIPVVA